MRLAPLIIALVACLGLAASGSPEDVDSVVPEMIRIEETAAKGKAPAKAAAKPAAKAAGNFAAKAPAKAAAKLAASPAHQPPTREEMENDPYLKKPVNPAMTKSLIIAKPAKPARPAAKGKPAAKVAAKPAAKPAAGGKGGKGKPAHAKEAPAERKARIALLRKKHKEFAAKLEKAELKHALGAAATVESKIGNSVKAFEKRAEHYEEKKAAIAIKKDVGNAFKMMNKEVKKELAAEVKKAMKAQAPTAVKQAMRAEAVKAKCGKAADDKSKARMCRSLHYMCDLKSANDLQKEKAKKLFKTLADRFNKRQTNKKEQITWEKKQTQFVKYVKSNCKLSCCKVEHDLWK
jgi:hypothetical protein